MLYVGGVLNSFKTETLNEGLKINETFSEGQGGLARIFHSAIILLKPFPYSRCFVFYVKRIYIHISIFIALMAGCSFCCLLHIKWICCQILGITANIRQY